MMIFKTFTAEDLIAVAADMVGPASDREDVNSEYIRAVTDIVATLLGMSMDDKDQVIAAINVREHMMAQICSQCGPGYADAAGNCFRHGKRALTA